MTTRLVAMPSITTRYARARCRRAPRRLCFVLAAAIVVAPIAFAPASVHAEENACHGGRSFRVRPQDSLATELLDRGTRTSATLCQMVEALELTDVIVLVETGWLPPDHAGQVRLLAGRGGVRYLRITLRIPRAESLLIETLGHELRHALEIARMSNVTDEKSLSAAYRKAGFRSDSDGCFDTPAARTAGAQVAHEVSASRELPH